MCTEIEAKLKVDSLSEVEHKLGDLGARFLGEQLQTDYFFDDVNATLTKTDQCLRLRKQMVEKSESYFLTYKGAKEKSNLKRTPDIQTEKNDAYKIYTLHQALAYEPVFIFQKKRRLWQLGSCEVALDQLPLLGDFVEIEGPNEEEITNVQNSLGLTDLPHISKSYASLLKEHLQQSDK